MPETSRAYRGRIAPSPTGLMHLGHARTFWTAAERVRVSGGTLVFRNEDIDPARCKPEFATAALEDLAWLGIRWDEGPDVGGPHAPYNQSERRANYEDAFEKLRAAGAIYPCTCSRKDIAESSAAPHETGDEPVYAGTCRPERLSAEENARRSQSPRAGVAWRFALPDGSRLEFTDVSAGPQAIVCGEQFGDFVVWRKDDWPSYQLAVTVDDAAMEITEVVRGRDLLVSTFRQLLLYEALGEAAPHFFHCPLVTDAEGMRLAKRHDALSLRALRAQGWKPEALRACWDKPLPATPL
ncbi:MAG TPA: tRNA glutamyl-Q(34) synthetase GluQRS [Opitutaceae bacterium]|nr:tRNA glutamyl-Q(34) synthetase GluQRS [Opitutaceae bacterium]